MSVKGLYIKKKKKRGNKKYQTIGGKGNRIERQAKRAQQR